MKSDQEILEIGKQRGGFVKLNDEEKEKYRELKKQKQEEVLGEARVESKLEIPEGYILLNERKLNERIQEQIKKATSDLTNENERLKNQTLGEWVPFKEDGKRNKVAKIGLYQEDTQSPFGVIIDWKFLRMDYDENTRNHDKQIYIITVLYNDEKKEYEVDWKRFSLEFLKHEDVEVIESRRDKVVRYHGKVRQSARKGGYIYSQFQNLSIEAMQGGGFVDQVEIADKVTVKIQRKNGQVLELPENRLNP